MTTLIRGGTIIDAENTYRAEVLCAARRMTVRSCRSAWTWRRPQTRRSSMRADST
ncbi:MAG: Dihydropyrimidinase (EC @ D-hydantoinase (EC [uncultured Paraburkholderia sp.]|nr:MAG: Dihydropyrimidinase (EC @ D-hydantoinase (EC [uncultured Paraburkholderia sp.]CAH2944694.1 MAG: Dihydropyrimidinase (EC @ D-hydantoinase (EC [uncultured Paraburkholderia sp.]